MNPLRKRVTIIRTASEDRNISGWWIIGAFIVTLFLSGFIFYRVTGDWRNAWLLFVPIVLLVVLIVVLFFIDTRRWSRGRSSFPKSLDLPVWCRAFVTPRHVSRRELSEMEMREIETSRKKLGEND